MKIIQVTNLPILKSLVWYNNVRGLLHTKVEGGGGGESGL